MTTWGMFGMLVGIFIVTPIVLLNRSRMSMRKLCLLGLPAIFVGNHLGWTLGPMIFGLMADGCLELPPPGWHAGLLYLDIPVAAIATGLLMLARRRRDRDAAEHKNKIKRAVERILADGVVHGPKGPYVPHKRWNAGLEIKTPRKTKGPGGRGPYGTPMK